MNQYLKSIMLLLMCCVLLLGAGCTQEEPILDATTLPDVEPDVGEIPNIPLEDKTINDEFYSKAAQVLLAAADAYVQRCEWIQYDLATTDIRNVLYRCPKNEDQEPERANSQNIMYTNCSAWIYNLYWEAFDYNIFATSCKNYFDRFADTAVYSGSFDIDRTDEQWEQICDEMLSILEPCDLIVFMHKDPDGGESSIGHIVMYAGNGKYVHSTGKSYNYEDATETFEEGGSVRYDPIADYLTPAKLKNQTRWIIVRPLSKIESIPQKSLTRFASMQGIVAQKLTSHPIGHTASPGDTVTYTIKITNRNTEPVVVEIKSQYPENTELVSADGTKGETLSWKIAVDAGADREVSYTVRIPDTAEPGSIITDTFTTVNDIQVYGTDLSVGKTLTGSQQEKISAAAKEMVGKSGEMAAIIDAIYKDALNFDFGITTDSALYESAFPDGSRTVTLDSNNPMLVIGKRCLYGGRYIKTAKNSPYPERAIWGYMLLPGDVLVVKQNVEDTCCIVYFAMENGNMLKMGKQGCEIIDAETTTQVLDSLLGMHSYVVLRPSLAQ